MNIEQLVQQQREYFAKSETKSINFRLNALQKLKTEIRAQKEEIAQALHEELGRHEHESYMAEIGFALNEIEHIQKHLKKWAKDKRVSVSLANFPSKAFAHYEPFGVCLIMSPWNYPFMLSISPLVGAIAAGNCAVLKPSAYSPAVSEILAKIIKNSFDENYICTVTGGREENSALLEQRFDFIFFTGSVEVGKLVMQKAAQHVCPVCLELGGKSPVIVDESANIKIAAKRIVFGKILNSGQTCVAPDYLLVHKNVKDSLLREMQTVIHDFLGEYPLESGEYPKMVNQKHYDRVKGLLQGQEIYCGGATDDSALKIAPTILVNVNAESPVMSEEIFGPILPVIAFEQLDEAVDFVNKREKPLALYLFTTEPAVESYVLNRCSFGGGCINDTIVHLSEGGLGFGGVGQSGMGNYHGKRSFTTFSHEKSILKKANWFDLKLRYHPYTSGKTKFLKWYWK